MLGVVEIPKGTRNKYEMDSKSGNLILDRVIFEPYPQNYGFIPHTMAPDKDPLDLFIISEDPIVPMTYVRLEVIGAIPVSDNGVRDDKIIAKVAGTGPYDTTTGAIGELLYFLRTYKLGVTVGTYGFKEEAEKVIKEAENYYLFMTTEPVSTV